FLNARVPAGQARDHFDQPAPVLVRRAGEAVARFVVVTGLEAVGAGHMAEDRIAVLLGDVLVGSQRLPPREARQRIELLVELAMVLDRRPGEGPRFAGGEGSHPIVW